MKITQDQDISHVLGSVRKFYLKYLNKFNLCAKLGNFSLFMKDYIAEQDQLLMILDPAQVIKKLDYSKTKYVNEVCNLIKLSYLAPATKCYQQISVFCTGKKN